MIVLIAQAAPGSIETPAIAWRALVPILILVGGALLLLVASALTRRRPLPGSYALVTVVTAGASIVSAVPLWREVTDAGRGPFTTAGGELAVDGFSVFFTVIIGAAVIVAALLADGYLRREGLDGSELYVLMLLSASGGVVMASANDLVLVFLGLEILSLAVYVLAAMHLRRVTSQEAGLKYFILGGFSSAFFLYGIAMVYGATGTTNLGSIAGLAAGPKGTPALLLAGFALLLVGFGFKVAAVPFHSWTPDVYQGSPTPVVAFMASGVKAAGFAGLLRVFLVSFGTLGKGQIATGVHLFTDDWRPFVYVLAVATLLVGAVLAVVQTDVKRMLAYSSISHAGFVLVGVQAGTIDGLAGALFYLAAYTFMVAGSFGVVTVIARKGDDGTSLDELHGLSARQPLLALVFAIFLFAQAGVPLTSGFFAKFYVLRAALEAGAWPLAVTAMLSAVIAAYLYLRIVVSMFAFAEADADAAGTTTAVAAGAAAGGPRLAVPFAARLALGLCLLVTLVVGFLPGPLADTSHDAMPAATAPGAPSK